MTASLEGWNSTTELRPLSSVIIKVFAKIPLFSILETAKIEAWAVSIPLKLMITQKLLSFAHETTAAEENERDDEIVTHK